jgi:hypothetical protein
MISFRWLHLTDFHWKSDFHRTYWGEIEPKLFDDIERLHKDNRCGGNWDVVFFTGDLVNKGGAGEYKDLNKRLKRLKAKLEGLGSKPFFLSVPGNHDLVRPQNSNPCLAVLTQLWDTDKNASKELWKWSSTSRYVKTIKDSFKNYLNWQKTMSYVFPLPNEMREGLLPGDFAATMEKKDFKIGVIGLNTAFLQLKEGNFEGKLEVNAEQIVRLCGIDHQDWVNKHDVCLLVSHHPENWLSPKGKEQLSIIAPPGRFVLHLCGHQHTTHRFDITIGGGLQIKRMMQANSIFGMEKYDYWNEDGRKKKVLDRRHGYCVGRIEFKNDDVEVRLWPRLGIKKANKSFAFERDYEQEFDEDKMDDGTPPFTAALKRKISPNNYYNHLKYYKTPIFNIQQKAYFVSILLECSAIQDQNTRNTIINELPSDIKNTIQRHPTGRVDVNNIVSRCQDFENGLSELMIVLESIEGSSLSMKKIKKFLSQIKK